MYNDRRSQGVLPLNKVKQGQTLMKWRLAHELIMQPGEQEKQVPIRGLLYSYKDPQKKGVFAVCACLFL